MADTGQGVCWSLERACALRTGEGWQLPGPTHSSLYTLQQCSNELSKTKPQIVNGIWITGNFVGRDSTGRTTYIPSSGIKIDEIGQSHGGWEAVRNCCANCEANILAWQNARQSALSCKAESKSAGAVGGCFGTLSAFHPRSGSLDELLWSVIERHQLEGQLRDAFQLTDPLWYGFWMNSPLDRKQCRGLLDLLGRAFDPAASHEDEHVAFLRALEVSLEYRLPLHVYVPPPGHTDMGYYTIFAHCPRCKAAADVPRWQAVESSDYECKVCGNKFDPATTHSSEPFEFGSEAGSLEAQMEEQYDAFALNYASVRGYSKERMLEALDIHRDGPTKRRVASTRNRVEAIQRQFGGSFSLDEYANLPHELLIEVAPKIVLEFVLAPAGQFEMGEFPSAEKLECFGISVDHESGEKTSPDLDWVSSLPIHTVTFARPFYIGKFPVTQAQWRAVMGNNPSKRRFPNHPVEQVDWFTAQEFCAQLSERLGRVMRLPSEAEWEYACRAGTTTRCYCGEVADRLHANLDHDTVDFFKLCDRTKVSTTPVDRFPPNPWGIYDMLGNVHEWCQDSWHDNYKNAPSDGSAWIDSPESVEHVTRGSAAYVIACACSSGARFPQRANCGADPQSDDADNEVDDQQQSLASGWASDDFFGLRLVCEPISDDRGV